MNRQAKRMMQRQKATPADRVDAMRQRQRAAAVRRKRTPPRQFLKEVGIELRKVNWPTRQELLSYTIVVLVAVVFLTTLVFGMDFAFSRGILQVFRPGA